MKTCQIAPSLLIQGDGSNIQLPLPAFINGACPYDIVDYALVANTPFTVNPPTIPTGSSLGMAVLVSPPGNQVKIALKGVSGDTGYDLGTCTPWAMLPIDTASPASFVLVTPLAAATIIVRIYWV